ncbi:MAG TPA: hypothetical protein DD643_05860 [Synechococcus sp. UBA8638]|nr:hypothetical protein [Synechococcus sp. UBA8638]
MYYLSIQSVVIFWFEIFLVGCCQSRSSTALFMDPCVTAEFARISQFHSKPSALDRFLVLAFGLSLSTVGGAAYSQEQADELDEVLMLSEATVFGADRDGRDLLETPSAVAVIDGEDMDRFQLSTYEDLLIDVPGLVIQGGREVAQEPNIRGFTDEQVVICVDGARQNFNLEHCGRFFVDPSLLKQVEVLRERRLPQCSAPGPLAV